MTCQFKPFGNIVDVEKVKTCLFHQDSISSEDAEDDAWNWSVDDDTNSNDNWLEECLLSLSPSSELLILAHQRNLAILGAKWDTSDEGEEKIKYYLNWHGDLCSEPSEKIASILCLPISAQGKSHCGADWTAIAVGFTSGALRFYTEKGSLLLSEILHDEPIVRLKCHTSPASSNIATEEVYVLYKTVVASIQGFVLCNTLRACRNQLARVEARCGDKVEAPPLALIKWSLSEQEKVQDVCVLGLGSTSGLAHLVTASIRGGYYAYYRATPPQTSTVIGVGTRPYVGFHIIMEGAAPPVLSDVAKAVATKVKSAFGQVVPGWLGRGRRPSSNEKTKEKGALEPAESMSCRFGLCDMIREGEKIYESPDRSLSAVCDTLGRVVLVDNSSGLAIRMWKGYRSAQCGFIHVEESEKRAGGRRALFLAIYAPKKGLVEVWALQQGPKLATLPATKNGQLFYVNYGLLGMNNPSSKISNLSQHPCVFVASSGQISHVSVPFHSILSKSNPRSRDEHILKQVKKALSTKETTDFIELCQQLSTAKAKKQALETAVQSSGISSDTLTAVIDHFSQKVTSQESSDGESSAEVVALERTISNLRSLLDLFEMTIKLQDQPPEYSTVVPPSPGSSEKSSVLWTLLQLTPAESEKIVTFISDAEAVRPREKSVKFSQTLNVYLSAFVSSLSTPSPLTLSKDVSNTDLAAIGELLCGCVLYGSCTVEDWKTAASDTKIQPRSLFFIALSYWLVKPHGQNAQSEIMLFHDLLSAILSLVSDVKETVQWWSDVRTNILECKKITNAMTATLITRSLYLGIEQRFSDVENDWEQVSDESFTWSQLISQVEAGAMLQIILDHKPPDELSHEPIPRLEYSPPDFTLSYVINRGPGMVCECVAKWCCAWGLRPEWLEAATPKQGAGHQIPDKEEQQISSVVNGIAPGTQPSSEAWETTTKQGEILELISGLRQHFPYTLSPGPLLAGQAWEYGSAWARSPDETVYLSVCFTALGKITSPHLRQGLCSIIWNVHLKNKFESTVRLLHKVGKLPKEKLCRQDINISDTTINVFLKYLINFFNLFIESAYEAESSSEMSKVKREPLWTDGSQHSLAEVCLAQATPSPPILTVQLTAARLLYLLSGLPVRLNRPITSLLDSLSESYLWSDIRKRVQLPPRPSEDPRLSSARLSFLTGVITAAVQPLAQQGEEGLTDSVKWMTQVYILANEWCLSLDPLRLHQVCRYYLVGCDRYAEEVVNAVNDKEQLGHHLLLIVGQRMKTILITPENRSEMKESLANLSPSLASWIYDQEELKVPCNIQDTFILLERVIHLLREGTTSDYRFAVLLYEAIEPLIKVS